MKFWMKGLLALLVAFAFAGNRVCPGRRRQQHRHYSGTCHRCTGRRVAGCDGYRDQPVGARRADDGHLGNRATIASRPSLRAPTRCRMSSPASTPSSVPAS